MNTKNRFAAQLLTGVGLAAISVSAAFAQASDEIVVTATKREQTLQEVPVAVSVVSADVIENAQIVDINDLQSSVSSLRVTQLQNASQTNFAIRGFGSGSNNPGIEPSVGVFIDGVYRSRAAAAILDLPDLERVEVLRGPQSTLFGKNVSIGAISITTKKPSYEWEGTAELTAGNLNARRFRGTLSGPISDTLAFRVSGSTNNRDGTYTNIVNGQDNLNERDRWAIRGQLLWEPTDTLSVRAIGDFNKIDETCCGTIQLANGPITVGVIGGALGGVVAPAGDPGARLSSLGQEPPNELRGKGASLQADWDLGFAVLTAITSIREQRDFNDGDIDFTSAPLATQPQEVNYETFTQEIRLAGEFETDAGVFNWIAGGFLFNEEVNFFQQTTFGPQFRAFGDTILAGLGTGFDQVEGASQLVAGLTQGPTALFPEFAVTPANGVIALPTGSSFAEGTGFTGSFDLDNRSTSLFFQTDWEITDRLTLTGGVAYTRDRKKADGAVVQTDPFQNIFLDQFATSGTSLLAAGIMAQGLGLAPDVPTGVGAVFADPTAFLTAAGTLAATDPATFGALRDGAAAGAAAAVAADPTANPIIAFTGLTALQFIPRQFPFPSTGDRDDDISLVDDGFAVDDTVNVTARIAYDLTDSLNVYFNYGTGYIAPAVNLSQDSQLPVIGPDGRAVGRFAGSADVRVFEIGGKLVFDGGFLNVALFDQQVTDFQSNSFTGTGFVLSNAGTQSVRGFEVEAAYSPMENLDWTFGLTYLDGEYDEFIGATCPTGGQRGFDGLTVMTNPGVIADEALGCFGVSSTIDASGQNPSGIHPVSITTAASYMFDLGNGNTLTPRVEYVYESAADLFDFGGPNVPQRKISQINANMAFRMENGFSVNLWARNLNNDDALITAFPSVAQIGSYQAYVTTPRTWGVSIRKDF